MYLPSHNFLVKLPSVEQVEKIFKVVRFILWNLLELVLLMTAMIGFAGQALRDVPAFREWLDQRPLKEPAPPSGPPDYATPPTEEPESQQPKENRRKPRPIPIVRVAVQRRRMELPVINRVSTAPMIETDPPIPLDVRSQYANPMMPFKPEAPKPRHNAARRAITAALRGIEAIPRKIRATLRDNKSSDSDWMTATEQ
jgi:hypothetical protein